MDTMLNRAMGAPGDSCYTTGYSATMFDRFDTTFETIENLTSMKTNNLTPAELPGNEAERMTFVHQYMVATLDEEELDEDDDLDEDLDDELDDADLDEVDVEEVDDVAVEDEDLDLDTDDAEEDDEDEDLV